MHKILRLTAVLALLALAGCASTDSTLRIEKPPTVRYTK